MDSSSVQVGTDNSDLFTNTMFKTMEITFSYLSLWEIFFAQEWWEQNTDLKAGWNNTVCAHTW